MESNVAWKLVHTGACPLRGVFHGWRILMKNGGFDGITWENTSRNGGFELFLEHSLTKAGFCSQV